MEEWKSNKDRYYCTMIHAGKVMGGKWPKLGEAVKALLGREHLDAHRAQPDMLAASDLYFEGNACQGDGVIPESYGATIKQRIIVADDLMVRPDATPEMHTVGSVIRAGSITAASSCAIVTPMQMSGMTTTVVTVYAARLRSAWQLVVEEPRLPR